MGLQRQSHGPSVQQAVEEAVEAFCGEQVRMQSAGRTDTGVHAYAMRSHIDLQKEWAPFKVSEALNAHLRPHPIAVTHCKIVPEEWHARFSCEGRSYIYKICNRRAPLTVDKNRAWQVPQPLDEAAMHDAAQLLTGQHDFTTFRSVNCQAKSPIKTLDRLDVYRKGEWVFVEAEALSFLHHQVRSMVGCLAYVGMGRWPGQRVEDALAARDRQALGLNAPPYGLYFVSAKYPNET